MSEAGHDVHTLARRHATLQGSLQDVAWLSAAVGELAPEVIFHLAASTQGRDGSAGLEGALDSNVAGSLNLMRAALTAGCRLLVHAS
ncbi:MAG: NAD-dependent epimerase/dehydratase family protein, partial [Myxococcales bacterium]|nr:NAD-dependent epimerase/dehydratase family protein [Myxococcales bacterium]